MPEDFLNKLDVIDEEIVDQIIYVARLEGRVSTLQSLIETFKDEISHTQEIIDKLKDKFNHNPETII